jgi:hypothetical protein
MAVRCGELISVLALLLPEQEMCALIPVGRNAYRIVLAPVMFFAGKRQYSPKPLILFKIRHEQEYFLHLFVWHLTKVSTKSKLCITKAQLYSQVGLTPEDQSFTNVVT